MKVSVHENSRIGPRTCQRSPAQAAAHMMMAARTYCGADKHCASATLKPMFSRSMIGRKNESA